MEKPSQTLPEGYRPIGTFDITASPRLVLILNLVGLGIAAVSAWVFSALLAWLRPLEVKNALAVEINSLGQLLGVIVGMAGLTALMMVLHEAAHGLFFWLFTRSRPKFAFKVVYAYAAAPGWFIPRWQYLIIGLAPLGLLSLLGVGLMAVIPPQGFLWLLVFLVGNAGGAVGDLWVMAWLIRQPPGVLAEDRGDAVTLYRLFGN